MPDLTMPSLGADMEAGTLLEWLVAPGEPVKRGDLVAVVDTDKAEIEIESFHDGVMGEQVVAVGTKVPVGTVLARIDAEGAPPAASPPPPQSPPPAESPPAVPAAPESAREGVAPAPVSPPAHVSPPAPAEHHARVSPLARRVAADLHVDPETLHGTGPHGSVVRADVEAAGLGRSSVPEREETRPAEPVAPAAPPADEDKGAAMRRAIANLMARSSREIPHYHLGTHVDMTAALAFLEHLNAERPIAKRILPAALLLSATARAAKEHPELNGFWVDDRFEPAPGVHLGVAVSLRAGGLVAPAIHDADTLTLDELMDALRDLVKRARAGRLTGAQMRDPSLTVTNLGDQGVETVHGVIYPPQVALVGFGRIATRPWAQGDMVGAHPVLHVTLAADHRASDGHTGGLFLTAIERRLQEPEAP